MSRDPSMDAFFEPALTLYSAPLEASDAKGDQHAATPTWRASSCWVRD